MSNAFLIVWSNTRCCLVKSCKLLICSLSVATPVGVRSSVISATVFLFVCLMFARPNFLTFSVHAGLRVRRGWGLSPQLLAQGEWVID